MPNADKYINRYKDKGKGKRIKVIKAVHSRTGKTYEFTTIQEDPFLIQRSISVGLWIRLKRDMQAKERAKKTYDPNQAIDFSEIERLDVAPILYGKTPWKVYLDGQPYKPPFNPKKGGGDTIRITLNQEQREALKTLLITAPSPDPVLSQILSAVTHPRRQGK